ncbi:MAG: hypothetical protein IKL21_06045 [Clostridia bacterium]|nr:hypothetical protein [Clostridia bacterium]
MKKLTVIILLFAVLFGISTAYISAEVNSGKDKVSFEENVLLGDKIYANGVTFSLESSYEYKLNWKTDYTIGFTPKCTTDYKFSPSGLYPQDDEYSAIHLSTEISHIKTISDTYSEVISEAKKENKNVSRTLMLRDIVEYFPITVDISLPNFTLSEENRKALTEKVNEFFKTPVPDDFEVVISAEAGGEYSSISCRDLYYSASGVYTDDTIFFSLYDKGTTAFKDYDKIYSLNYDENTVYEDTLKVAYDPGENFIESNKFVTEKTLVILGEDSDCKKTFLRVLDLKTMQCIQDIKLFDEGHINSIFKNDFIEVETYDDNMNYEIYFYKALPDGTYEYGMTVYESKYFFGNDITAIDFDGKRAVFAQATFPHLAGGRDFYNVTVSVYDESGVLYIGEYKCNLTKHNKGDHWMAQYGYSLDVNIG